MNQAADNTPTPFNGPQFESDTQRLVRLHLQDKNHVITEEELKSVRVGMVPPENVTPLPPGAANETDPASSSVLSRENPEP